LSPDNPVNIYLLMLTDVLQHERSHYVESMQVFELHFKVYL